MPLDKVGVRCFAAVIKRQIQKYISQYKTMDRADPRALSALINYCASLMEEYKLRGGFHNWRLGFEIDLVLEFKKLPTTEWVEIKINVDQYFL